MILDSPVWILKLGGSILTFKEKEDSPNLDVIRRLGDELRGFRGLLVLGVGSFGHQRAIRYRLWEGVEGRQWEWTDVRRSVERLASMVIDSLLDARVPALTLSLPALWRAGEMDFSPVQGLIDLGLVPVLHGDGFPDPKKGLRVVSGDEIAARAASALKGVEGVVFAVDVDGIYEGDPKKREDAGLIEEISREELLAYAEATGDFSGGMRGKARFIASIPKEIPVYVVNGLVPGRIRMALEGRPIGTKIY